MAVVLSSCSPPLQYDEYPEATWVRGEQIEFKRKYKDVLHLGGCITKQNPPQYKVVFSLAPHGGVWGLTLTQHGSRIVEAYYSGNYMFTDGTVEIEWSRGRRPYDDVAALKKAAESAILACTTPA